MSDKMNEREILLKPNKNNKRSSGTSEAARKGARGNKKSTTAMSGL